MSDLPGAPKKRKFGKMEALILIPNLLIIGGILFYLAATSADDEPVEPLVDADPQTAAQIAQLEAALVNNPGDLGRAIRLSKLYSDVGEFPFSYSALKNAEKRAGNDPALRIKLGLAYLELGKNNDGLRVMEAAIAGCRVDSCDANVRVKLGLFARVARIFKERGIDSRKEPRAADKALKEVFKPVKADPEKMRPKAPAAPEGEEPAKDAPAKDPAKEPPTKEAPAKQPAKDPAKAPPTKEAPPKEPAKEAPAKEPAKAPPAKQG